jgi:hypothetical protein
MLSIVLRQPLDLATVLSETSIGSSSDSTATSDSDGTPPRPSLVRARSPATSTTAPSDCTEERAYRGDAASIRRGGPLRTDSYKLRAGGGPYSSRQLPPVDTVMHSVSSRYDGAAAASRDETATTSRDDDDVDLATLAAEIYAQHGLDRYSSVSPARSVPRRLCSCRVSHCARSLEGHSHGSFLSFPLGVGRLLFVCTTAR